MSTHKFVIGGPFYKGLIDIRTMTTIMSLVGNGPKYGWQCLKFMGQDALLDIARNRLMDEALASGAEWFISIDADISVNPNQYESIFACLEDSRRYGGDLAVVGFPTRNAHGGWNVVKDGAVQDGLSTLDAAQPLAISEEVDCIGTGLIAFRLGWYAKHWPEAMAFFQTVIVPAAPPGATRRTTWAVIGEDYGHCNAVHKLGGKVVADWRVRGRHHMNRPGSPESKGE